MCRAGEVMLTRQAPMIGALPRCNCTIMVQWVVHLFCSKNLKLLICTTVYLARFMQHGR
jgi:hypothetical protein